MHLEKFAIKFQKATNERQMKAVLFEYFHYYKITGYAFTLYAGHTKSGRKLKYHCVSDALSSWHHFYLEQGYADLDRTLEESNTITLPLFWDLQEQLFVAKNNRELQMRKESIEYGIDKGLSIPVYGPLNDFATLTLHQFRHENCLQNYKLLQYEWLSAAILIYNCITKILNLNKNNHANYSLTKREEQCLNLTVKMWRVEKIAKELGISPRTVNFHIQNANKKLGTNNKYQTIYKLQDVFFHIGRK